MIHRFIPIPLRIPTNYFFYGNLSQSGSTQCGFNRSLFDLYFMLISNMAQCASSTGTKYRAFRRTPIGRRRITGHYFCNLIIFALFHYLCLNLVPVNSTHAENHTSILLANAISQRIHFWHLGRKYFCFQFFIFPLY